MMNAFKNWSIGTRLFATVALPTLMVASLISAYHIFSHIRSEYTALERYGMNTARATASAMELGIVAQDIDQLQEFAQFMLQSPDIHGVSFLNENGRTLVSLPADLPMPIAAESLRTGAFGKAGDRLSYYIYGAGSGAIDFVDHEESFRVGADTRGDTPENIGWVIVFVDESNIANENRQMLRGAALITVLGLSLAFLLARLMSRSLTKPLGNITTVVRRISHGDMSTEIDTGHSGELGELQKGLQRMSQMLGESQATQEEKINVATRQLQETLHELESQNRELEQAREHSELANKAKDEFLARMSHELRTPITSISGYINLLKQTPLADNQSTYLNVVSQASEILLGTVNDILDLSELEQQEINFDRTEFELELALDNMISMHESNAFRKGIEIIVDVEQATPRLIFADKFRLIQICNNLVSNAVKFTKEGFVFIGVHPIRKTGNLCVLEFVVKDSGIGIDEEHIELIFEPFHQGDTSIRRRYGGTGLGLMIARNIVEQMGGALELKSVRGEGTEARFTIPVTAVHSEEQAPLPTHTKPILLLDSNTLSLSSLRSRLLRLSSNVYTAPDINRFLKLLEQEASSYHCLVVSLQTGQSTTDFIANLLQRISVLYSGDVVLLCSCVNAEELLESTPYSGLNSVSILGKPLRSEQLVETLSKLMQIQSEQGTTPERNESLPLRELPYLDEKNILIAEDNHFNMQLIQELLAVTQANVDSAENGPDALYALCQLRGPAYYDLLLADLHMPEMDGFELAEEARNLGFEGKIIMLSADQIRDEKLLSAGGINDFLLKPLDEPAFFALLEKHLLPARTVRASRPLLQVDPTLLENEIARLSAEIRASLRPYDAQECEQLTHQLKGLTGLSARAEIAQLCEQIHSASLERRADRLGELLDNLARTRIDITQHAD